MSFTAEPKADLRLNLWTQVTVGGVGYLRLPLHTRWLNETDDLALSLKESLSLARPGDTVGVSEKVAIFLTGRTVDISTMRPGRLARMLAGHVRPRGEHARGLSVPEKRSTHPYCRLKADHHCRDRQCRHSPAGHARNL